MLINLFIIVFILLVIHCVWQNNKINKISSTASSTLGIEKLHFQEDPKSLHNYEKPANNPESIAITLHVPEGFSQSAWLTSPQSCQTFHLSGELKVINNKILSVSTIQYTSVIC